MMHGDCVLALAWLMSLAISATPEHSQKPVFAPIFTGRPFIVAWNAPTQDCKPRFKVHLDLTVFDVDASPNEGWVDQDLTIFYKERLGLYPYYDGQKAVNGGVPQNSSFQRHLELLPEGIHKYIRSKDKEGLAVIDWEEWRPIWLRNWQTKDIYRSVSRQLVMARQHGLSEEEINKQAQYEFETSARNFMQQTLQHAKSHRPRQLWGFYLFPDCYNHDYSKNQGTYTGQCPDVEKSRNDHLSWLWKESTALYPSIYLEQVLASSANGRKFVTSRVKEALRISEKHHDDYNLPVFVYTRPTYTRKLDVLSEIDLVSTIGESAALGAAGAVFWGDADYTKSRDTCQIIKNYIEEDLGRYIVNVTTAAELCSQTLCSGHGRCLRQDSDASVFLHLNPANFRIHRNDKTFEEMPLLVAKGKHSQEDVAFLRNNFKCHCYQGWRKADCSEQLDPQGDGSPCLFSSLGLQLLLTLSLLACLH